MPASGQKGHKSTRGPVAPNGAKAAKALAFFLDLQFYIFELKDISYVGMLLPKA